MFLLIIYLKTKRSVLTMGLMNKNQTIKRMKKELGTSLGVEQVLKNKYFTEEEYQTLKTSIVQLARRYYY